MIRGFYTGASSMAARVNTINVISNNLANVNTSGFKKDLALFKAHPEMVIRRNNDDGVRLIPIGSLDIRPVVGRLGTGVELNEVYTQKEQGSLQSTENPLDLAIEGKGYFTVLTDKGERYTRNGGFTLNDQSYLTTLEGHAVLGEKGPIKLKDGNFTINPQGRIFVNRNLETPPDQFAQIGRNGYEEVEELDRLRVVNFPLDRYLVKEGSSFYRTSEESGEPFSAFSANNAAPLKVLQGFKENSNVNPVNEMVNMIEVQRSYEASQKTITSGDMLLDKLINQMARV